MIDRFSTPDGIDWGQPVNWADPLNRGLVSWWLAVPNRMGWGSLKWRDMVRRSQNNGTLTSGPAWQVVRGRPGGWGALDFSAAGSYVVAPASALTRPCTVTLWFKPLVGIGSGNQWLVAHDSGANDGWRVARKGGPGENLAMTFGSVAEYSFSTLTFHPEDIWYFVACVIPADSGTTIGYIQAEGGGAMLSESMAVGNMSGTPTQYSIGNLSWFDDGADGPLDDVRIYNRALSATEISKVAQASRSYYPGVLNRVRRTLYAPEQAVAAGNRRRRVLIGACR